MIFKTLRQQKLSFSRKQYEKINQIVDLDKGVLNYGIVIKLNKAAAFLTFVTKEIYDYINMKSDDGAMIFDVRNKYIEVKEFKKQLDVLNSRL